MSFNMDVLWKEKQKEVTTAAYVFSFPTAVISHEDSWGGGSSVLRQKTAGKTDGFLQEVRIC